MELNDAWGLAPRGNGGGGVEPAPIASFLLRLLLGACCWVAVLGAFENNTCPDFFPCTILVIMTLCAEFPVLVAGRPFGARGHPALGHVKYGPPTRTPYRVIVENLSSRISWQVGPKKMFLLPFPFRASYPFLPLQFHNERAGPATVETRRATLNPSPLPSYHLHFLPPTFSCTQFQV
ncbi:Serine/arginine-rich splicing factor 4 [Portunus trituberculatus]|uniref:Serine/arginine-rich splicing factor 4 n=1 Tax=Portunus trituberculatus TaxID=210409 RepID=A0A5B7EN41_PORTR|nr:Serine/arginine-rich splicing factor 4 [Portunus trituberculatus]